MTVESQSNEPNEFGFAGGATAPEPEPTMEPIEEVEGESVAIPAGDITGAITESIDELTEHNDDDAADKSR
jgi:hypothetical protein